MATTARLPGIYFQADPVEPPEVLPRMDIAAFVGFAPAGPLHVPVPIEDTVRFRQIFHPANDSESPALYPLAWDAARGSFEYAHLGPAVEAFFRNGGRRCWVVRVASVA